MATTTRQGATKARFGRLVDDDMIEDMIVGHGANTYNALILKFHEQYGLTVDPKNGTVGTTGNPSTDRMTTFEFQSKGKPVRIYLPRACFIEILDFRLDQYVLLAKPATDEMFVGPDREDKALIFNLDATKKGLEFGKSMGVVTSINSDDDILTVKFEEGCEIDMPQQCLFPIM